MRRATEQHGQVMPLAVFGLLALLLAVAGLAIDVGSWYRAQRHMQAVADAAALAAVQALPDDPARAADLAREYASKNGGSILPPRVTTSDIPNDTIKVQARVDAPAFFARIAGIGSVAVHASAAAQAAAPTELADVVPIGVAAASPALSCGPRCFGEDVTLTYDDGTGGVRSAWGMIDFSNGHANPHELADWLRNGYPDPLPPGIYESDPGNKFRPGPVRDAIEELAERHALVLLPVWRSVWGHGGNAQYDVIGFAAFRIKAFDSHAGGSASELNGSFEHLIVHGSRGRGANYFGVKTVKLVRGGGDDET